MIVALWQGRLPLVSALIVTDGLLLSTVTLVLPPGNVWLVPDRLHISLMLEALLMPVTCSALLPLKFTEDDTVPVKYSTLVSAPPAYVKVPTLVLMVRPLRELFWLSTISLKTSATVIGSPGR